MEAIFNSHDTFASNDEVKALVTIFNDENVKFSSIQRLTTALNSPSTVKAFVHKWQLSCGQEAVLMWALCKYCGVAEASVDWYAWNTMQKQTSRSTVVSPISRAVSVAASEAQSSKVRKLETSIRKQALEDVGKMPGELSIVCKTTVLSMQEIRARDKRMGPHQGQQGHVNGKLFGFVSHKI